MLTLACKQLESEGRLSTWMPMIFRIADPMPSAPMTTSCWNCTPLANVMRPVEVSTSMH